MYGVFTYKLLLNYPVLEANRSPLSIWDQEFFLIPVGATTFAEAMKLGSATWQKTHVNWWYVFLTGGGIFVSSFFGQIYDGCFFFC